MSEGTGKRMRAVSAGKDAVGLQGATVRNSRVADVDLLSDAANEEVRRAPTGNEAGGDPGQRSESEAASAKQPTPKVAGWEALDAARDDEKPTAESKAVDVAEAAEGPEWLHTLIADHPHGAELAALVASERSFRKLFPTSESAEFAREQAEHLMGFDQLFYSQNPENAAEFVAKLKREGGSSFEQVNRAWADQFLEEIGSRAEGSNDQELLKAIEVIRDRVGGSDKRPFDYAQGRPAASLSAENRIGRGNLRRREEELERREQELRREEFTRFFRACDQACESTIRERIEQLVGGGHFSPKQKQAAVREIYEGLRETLSADTLFMGRMATAVRMGNRGEGHQKQVVELFVNRARQALPEMARRVLSEWTQQVLNEEQSREAKRRNTGARAEVGGGGESSKGRVLPRVNYRKMTDMDIVNL